MRNGLPLLAAACLFAGGCAKTDPTNPEGPPAGGPGGLSVSLPGPGVTVTEEPIPIQDGEVKITPDNSSIGFKGTKADGQHTGGFEKFTGTLKLDKDSKAPQAIEVTIDTDSLVSDNQRLTGHLKSPDFFDVKQFPEARFVSKGITARDAGKGEYTVKGDLTLHGTTKEIEFPVTITTDDKGLRLTSTFKFDRTEYGISYEPARVHKEVTVNVVLGQKKTQTAGRGGRGGPGGGPGGGFDPRAIFERRDANKDGKLTGDEISERMRPRLDQIDTDKDGAISQEEFLNGFRGPGGPGGGGPGGPGGGGRGGPGGGRPGGGGDGRPARPAGPDN